MFAETLFLFSLMWLNIKGFGNVYISEAYSYSFVKDDNSSLTDYIELKGIVNTTVDDYTVILYGWSGQTRQFPRTIHLTGKIKNPDGYYVISTPNATFTADLTSLSRGSVYRGETTLLALYRNYKRPLFGGVGFVKENVVDVALYGKYSSVPYEIYSWKHGLQNVQITEANSSESVSRCFTKQLISRNSMTLAVATPGLPNQCPSNKPKVSEIHIPDGRSDCYIELDFGDPLLLLNSFYVVLYTELNSTLVNKTFDLWNQRSDPNGFFLLKGVLGDFQKGSERVLHCEHDLAPDDTPVAISIYQVDDMNGSTDIEGSNASVLHTVIYQLNSTSSDNSLFSYLSGHIVSLSDSETAELRKNNSSLSLCNGHYILTQFSPKLVNFCSADHKRTQATHIPTALTTKNIPDCLLMPSPGSCSDSFSRIYFDSTTGTCRRFNYTGCGGNGNNFLTETECLRHCKSN